MSQITNKINQFKFRGKYLDKSTYFEGSSIILFKAIIFENIKIETSN